MINENPQTATNQEQEMECNCEHWQQCVTCKLKTTPAPVPHKHAAMIKEWSDDTSRAVEYQPEDDEWYKFTGAFYNKIERFEESCGWRFADQVIPVKPEIVTSLSDLLLREIFISYAYPSNPAERADDLRGIRAIANAAAKRAVDDYKHQKELKAELLEYLIEIGNINKENKFSPEITRYLRKAIEVLNKVETTE